MNEQKPKGEKLCQLCGGPWHVGVKCAGKLRKENDNKVNDLINQIITGHLKGATMNEQKVEAILKAKGVWDV